MKLMKKLLAGILVAAIALSMTACSDTKWVFDYDGEKIPSGVYIAFTINAYSEAQSHKDYKQEIKDMFSQTIEGKKAKDWMIEKSQETANRYMAIEKKFKEMNLELTEKDQNIINKNFDTNWSYIGKVYEENGVSADSYKKTIENAQKATLIFNAYYGKNGVEEIATDKLLVHFKENFASVNSFALPLKTGDKLTEEDKKANEDAKKKAEEYVTLFNEGKKSLNELADDYLVYSKQSEKKSEDIKKDEDTKFLVKKDSEYPSKELVSDIFTKVKTDEKAVLLSTDSAYYIFVRYDVTKDQNKFDEMRESILYDIKGEDFNKMVDEWAKAMSPTVNSAAVNKYSPKHIKLK